MNCLATADRPSTTARSRTAADIGSGCCNSAVPGAGHSREDGSVAAAAAVGVSTVLSLTVASAAVVPASATMIRIDYYVRQWDSRLDYVARVTTTNGLGSFGIVAAVAVIAAAAGQVIAP